MEYFENVTPESVGIASSGIINFIDDVRKKGIEQHSLMIIRHGKCCAKGWWKPYGPEYLHPLYSFSKTFTATAIGFAEQEGLLSLDEKLVDLFPDKLPEEVSENLREVTLHDLLIMGCGHETEIDGLSPDWIREFLAHPFLHKPGTFYKYNTAGTNMLAAVLKRKTGQDVTEFLRPRLLDPLGIDTLYCYHLPDEDSTELGGGGMKLTTENMARFTYFLLHKGNWEGRQLLNKDWFDRACTKQIETANDSEGHTDEWANGYGYQCWMCSLPESFRADGAYGQFGFVYPTLDMIVVMTSATDRTQALIDSMMDYLIPAVHDQVLAESEDSGKLSLLLENLSLPVCAGDRCPVMEKRLNGQIYLTTAVSPEQGCSSMEILIGGSGNFDLFRGEITRMSFSVKDDCIYWKVYENQETREIAASLAHRFEISSTNGILYAASARWRSFGVLEMEIRRLDALSGSRIIFRFSENGLTLTSDDTLVTAGGLGLFPKQTVPFRLE
ncbi:MAG: serine hydrolase [Fusicatenibacter sp.]|nr:serine hydrolase [Lachnospiraceae bacterium]MDY2939253.1 serine hydrolase [Fusicatenibacter sp.]